MTTLKNHTTSVNQLSGQAVPIPHQVDDTEKINAFVARHPGKPVIVVQGLGFVGAVMSLVCANALTEEYAVIGVDLPSAQSYWKIVAINEGQFPIIASDPKIDEYFQRARAKGNFMATADPYCYSKANVVIVDINLDVDKQADEQGRLLNYDVDLAPFSKAIKAIGDHCREDVLVLVETTVPAGTCQKVVKPILVECLEERGLSSTQFKLGHSYERVMPGPDYIDSIQNFYRVYSGVDERSANATEAFLRTIISTEQYPLTRLGSTNATEMAKTIENSYRAANIAFAVEWSRFAEEAGVNLYEVVDAVRMRPTHQNLMYPGIGVGGYCLTKDPLLASWSRLNLFASAEGLDISVSSVGVNDQMPCFAYEFMRRQYAPQSLSKKRVLLLGVSYRSNVADTRYSPVESFYNRLVQDECDVYLHDPYVRHWEETGLNVHASYEQAFAEPIDLLVLSTGHAEYKDNPQLLELCMAHSPMFILDTIGLLSQQSLETLATQHTVRVVGRGDLQ